MTILVQRKFSIYSQFLDTILQSEDEIREGETRKDALKRVHRELEETAADLRKESESMRGQIVEETIQGAKITSPPIGPAAPIEINIKDERIQIAIENAQTSDELKDVKTVYPVMPFPLLRLYNKRMEELTNESNTSFTSGLE